MKLIKIIKYIIISIIACVILFFVIDYFISSGMQKQEIEGDLIYTSTSPRGNYKINFYLKEPTEMLNSFTILGVLNYRNNKGENIKRNIYLEYKTTSVEANWIDENTVIINGHRINNVEHDVYDWRE